MDQFCNLREQVSIFLYKNNLLLFYSIFDAWATSKQNYADTKSIHVLKRKRGYYGMIKHPIFVLKILYIFIWIHVLGIYNLCTKTLCLILMLGPTAIIFFFHYSSSKRSKNNESSMFCIELVLKIAIFE